ncbi:MAG: hypothetical protein DRQ10_02710 [Candidatus Hydrothermota bacterium]|nr:MAG: hypothetical protein DRQ10_02710 [Candidatus Hydrothermae bacterium]
MTGQILWAIFMPILVIIIGLIYMGLARKITARIHNRYGPPFYQNIIDVIKLFSKKDVANHGVMFSLGPVIAVAGMVISLLFIPIGNRPLLSFNGDIIVLLYLLVIAPLGMALGVGEGANPNGAIGIARALTLMLGYEVVLVIAAVAVMIHAGSASFMEIIRQQQGGVAHWFIWPLFLSALATDIALQAILGEKPFDQPIAPHEIASGPMVEYGGKFLGMLQIYHAIAIIVETGIFVNLFLGGGSLVWWFVKSFAVFFVALLINAVMPRFRIGQAFKFYWTYPAAIGLVGLIIVAIT